jgi:fumarate reductase iron-sulfur subunit
MADVTNAKILRYNPSRDAKPYYKTYQVPWRPLMSVLEMLRYIHEELEPISFEYSCRSNVCGQCSLQVNGKPALACTVVVPTGDILIEPLAGFPVIKDLVVDRSELTARLYGIRPWWSRTKPITEPMDMTPDAFVKTSVAQNCKGCLLCHAACPVVKSKGFSAFGGPYIMIRIAMRYLDTREELADERLKTAVSEGLFNCDLCGQCDDVCPMAKLVEVPGYPNTNINLVKTFKAMQDAAKAKGWGA